MFIYVYAYNNNNTQLIHSNTQQTVNNIKQKKIYKKHKSKYVTVKVQPYCRLKHIKQRFTVTLYYGLVVSRCD